MAHAVRSSVRASIGSITMAPPHRHYGTEVRILTQGASEQPIAIIAGAGAKTARVAIGMLLRNGVRVVALTGQDMKERVEGLHIKQIDRRLFASPMYVARCIREALAEMEVSSAPQIIGINLIGAAVPPRGFSLMEINHDIPMSFFEGFLAAVKDRTDRISLAQLSSIAITINGDTNCSYVDSKKKTEQSLFQLNPKGTVLSFRSRDDMPCARPAI